MNYPPASFGEAVSLDLNPPPIRVAPPLPPRPLLAPLPSNDVIQTVPNPPIQATPIEVPTPNETPASIQATPIAVVTTPPVSVATPAEVLEPLPSAKKCTEAPWPTIIVAVVGVGLAIYTGVAPDINSNLRIFGLVLLLLWTILWGILLWVLWHECHQGVAWWLLILPIATMLLFFILIIILKLGVSQ